MSNEKLDLIVTPLRSALLAGHNNKLHVLVRVQAPDAPESKTFQRGAYGVSFVIDRSGSMSGNPLEEAIRCVGLMAQRLRDDDLAALITFDNRVALEHPLLPISQRNRLNDALANIVAGGNTNLHGGWREGAEELSRHESQVSLKRVVILSDGCANEGVTSPAEIGAQAAEFSAAGITTSSYGLGRNFNEELMIELANAGQGNHYYAETAEDLLESFNEEFELMANLWSRELTLNVIPMEGVTVRMMNNYPALEDQSDSWRLPGVAFGSEAWAILELGVPESLLVGSSAALLTLKVEGRDLDCNPVRSDNPLLKLSVVSDAAYGAIAEDELVKRRLDEVMASQFLNRARQAVREGDWDGADQILDEARARFKSSPWAQDVLQSMEKLASRRDDVMFMKEAMFSSRKMSHRLASKSEAMELNMEVDSPAFLRRKTAQGKAQFVKPEKGSK